MGAVAIIIMVHYQQKAEKTVRTPITTRLLLDENGV